MPYLNLRECEYLSHRRSGENKEISWTKKCEELSTTCHYNFDPHPVGGIPTDRGSDRPIIVKGPLDRGSDRPIIRKGPLDRGSDRPIIPRSI